MRIDYSREEASELFAALEVAVAERNDDEEFPVRRGSDVFGFGKTRNDVSAEEFMLMEGNETEVRFKHRDTRNYVILRRSIPGDAWRLFVPMTKNAFFRGYFDKA